VQAEDNVVELRRDHEASMTPSSFDDLFLDHHDRLYRALYFVTGSREDAEELMQDAFLKLWERWDTIRKIDDPVAWLFRVSLNGFRMRKRRAAVAVRRLMPIPVQRDPYDDIELNEDIRRMLLGLTPRAASCARSDRDLRFQLRAGRRDPRHPAGHRPRARLARACRTEGDVRRPRCQT
jgi:RNA polymerase sigma factor (sigma-70 family)